MSHSAHSPVQPGDILAGKYRVDQVLGEGGMGIVVAAHHIQLDQKVALKFLLPAALLNPVAVARFVREARTAVRMTSEHVARVTDVGELENGAPYMVMEYLEGGDLAAWLEQRGPMAVEQAVEFILQTCVAVADAHALGVVHRDLKPANLFCIRRNDGNLAIKVLDFGISKVTDPSAVTPASQMTKTSSVMGTPLYMAPEQMRSSKTVDARADIWALGVVLFELIAGKLPFAADTLMELTLKVANDPPPPLSTVRPDIPPGLDAVILKCLEKDPSNRYKNVGDLSVALLPFAPKRARPAVDRISGIMQAAGLSGSDLEIPPSREIDANNSRGTLPPVGQTLDRKSPPPAIGAVVFAMIAIASAAAFFLVPRRAPDRRVELASQASVSAPLPPTAATPAPSPVPDPTVLPARDIARANAPVALPSKPQVSRPAPRPSAAASAAKSRPDCTPDFTYDSDGNKVWKPECFK